MHYQNARNRSSLVLRLLGSCLLAFVTNGHAAENAAVGQQETGERALPVEQAMAAMAGMGGIYRVDAAGDTYLYPVIKLKQDIQGMHGVYYVTPQGITLRPTGMEAPDLGMSSMGGVAGSFRVTPNGDAYFQPKPHDPIGMSGESGREQHRGISAP
jgi:hypothetical protein